MSEDRLSKLQSKLEEINEEVDSMKENIIEGDNSLEINSSMTDYDAKIEELKNEVKVLKILKKQKEKIEKLEEKKREILREMEVKDEHRRKRKDKRRKRKRD